MPILIEGRHDSNIELTLDRHRSGTGLIVWMESHPPSPPLEENQTLSPQILHSAER